MQIGCHNYVPALDSRYPPPPPNNASTLSGGKITQFVPAIQSSLNNSVDRELLKACRQLKLTSHTAYGAYYVVKDRTGTDSFSVLVVGKQMLVTPNQLIRQMELPVAGGKKGYSYRLKGHMVTMSRDGAMLIYTGGPQFPQQYIVLTPGSSLADVGGTKVKLQQPVVWLDDDKVQVILLDDWLKLFRVSDTQTGEHSIQPVGVSLTIVTHRS